LLQAVTHFFEVPDHCITKILRDLSHLFLVAVLDITALSNNELTGE